MFSGYEGVSHVVLISISLITNDAGCFLMLVAYLCIFLEEMFLRAMLSWNWNKTGPTEPLWPPVPRSQLVQDPEGKWHE